MPLNRPDRSPLITRFAPSPTGFLHKGHLMHILYVYGIAKAWNARLILRIEDHDRGRCRPEYEEAILRDLEMLGLAEKNPGSTAEGGSEQLNQTAGIIAQLRTGKSDFRQSDCGGHYEAAVEKLRQNENSVYYCDCSRKQILTRTGQQEGELRYDGFCRNRNLKPGPFCGIRLRLPQKSIQFEDLNAGVRIQNPALQTGDLLLQDREGNWTYQFAVVVDDLRHGCNLIIRGQDLISSTGRQLLLAELLGATQPFSYFHHPLIKDEKGRKLSKMDFDEDIHQLLRSMARDNSAHQVNQLFGEVASLAGLIAPGQTYSPAEFADSFLFHR